MTITVGTRTTPTETPSTTVGNRTVGNRTLPRATRIAAIVTMVAGLLMAAAGAATWFTVQGNLADERITVSEDSPRFANEAVDGPFTAFQEAQMIEKHYLESTKGATYAELDREDPARATAMTASFLRASLFTSVVSFGVAAMAFGIGLVLFIVGFGLYALGRSTEHSTA
jgi:hypothetical protein